MKGGLQITILFSALLCDKGISGNDTKTHTGAIKEDSDGQSQVYDGLSEDKIYQKAGDRESSIEIDRLIENVLPEDKNTTAKMNGESKYHRDPTSSDVEENKKKNIDDVNIYLKDDIKVYFTEFTQGMKHAIFPKQVEGEELFEEDREDFEGYRARLLKPAMYSTICYYSCTLADDTHKTKKHLIVFGSKAWNFPLQDVNLTLSYPTEEADADSAEEVDYIITGFMVVMFIDGKQTRGYINSGGILHNNISITIINRNITSLFYRFWLYGVPRRDDFDWKFSNKYHCT